MSGDRKPVEGLRSPREGVGGLVYFGRMVDKLRLEQAGKLPEDYRANLGEGFDKACCDFLGVSYEKLRTRVREGGTDEEILVGVGRWVGRGIRRRRESGGLILRNGVGEMR